MMKYAVVDLEATSASHTSKIIQIGIVIVEDGRIITTFQSDVNPNEAIDPHITSLTGITTEQVLKAPNFDIILPEVSEMLEGCVFVAHNVKFDYNLLERTFSQYGAVLDMKRVDTIELARIFLPTLKKYGLETLAHELKLTHDRPHEALSDAFATAKLLILLQNKMANLPKQILVEIEKHATCLIYETNYVISEQLKVATSYQEQLNYVDRIATLKPDRLVNKNLVDQDFEKNLKQLNLAYRKTQHHFATLINKRLSDSKASFIEAPTGIGKTYAYLLTLLGQNEKIIVSVPTKVLQNQMMQDVAPALKQTFGVAFVKLLGTKNYISIEKFRRLLDTDDDGKNYEIFKMKVLVWLTETKTGELDELNLTMTSQSYLDSIRHSGDVAKGQLHFEQDFWQLTQENARHAQVLVMNHAYLAERIQDQTELFEDKVLVVDEAQQLFSILETAHQKSVKVLDELVEVDTHASHLNKRLLESLTYQLSRRQLDITKIRLDAQELGLSGITDVLANPEDFVWLHHHMLTSSPTDFLNFAAMLPEKTKTYLIGATLSMSEKHHVFPELLGFDAYTFDTITTDPIMNQQVFVATDSLDLTMQSPQDYATYLASEIIRLKELGKPIVVLFTSHDSLSRTADALTSANVSYLQSDSTSDASRLKQKFDAQPDAILLGSKKFWEGVDFDKQDELILVIPRLPFSVPDDILIRKYAKRFDNPFYDFSVPLATLQLQQAFGRVNRRETQKSTVIIFDKRLAGKTYAKKMLYRLEKYHNISLLTTNEIMQQTEVFLR